LPVIADLLSDLGPKIAGQGATFLSSVPKEHPVVVDQGLGLGGRQLYQALRIGNGSTRND